MELNPVKIALLIILVLFIFNCSSIVEGLPNDPNDPNDPTPPSPTPPSPTTASCTVQDKKIEELNEQLTTEKKEKETLRKDHKKELDDLKKTLDEECNSSKEDMTNELNEDCTKVKDDVIKNMEYFMKKLNDNNQ